MPSPAFTLATAEELRAIARRAIEVLCEGDADPDAIDEPDAEEGERVGAALEALRFCGVAARALGDPALLPLLLEALSALDGDEDPPVTGHFEELLSAARALLAGGAPVVDGVRALAEHPRSAARAAVAAGLSPRGLREIAL